MKHLALHGGLKVTPLETIRSVIVSIILFLALWQDYFNSCWWYRQHNSFSIWQSRLQILAFVYIHNEAYLGEFIHCFKYN